MSVWGRISAQVNHRRLVLVTGLTAAVLIIAGVTIASTSGGHNDRKVLAGPAGGPPGATTTISGQISGDSSTTIGSESVPNPLPSSGITPATVQRPATTAPATPTTTKSQTGAPPPDWQLVSPQDSPTGSNGASLAYDPSTKQVVLYDAPNAPNSGETWIWNGTGWDNAKPATSPPQREEAPMAYDPASGQLVLFGGIGAQNYGDTWIWGGTSWHNATPQSSPPGRYAASMAYDASTRQLVLFGGAGPAGRGSDLDDTWLWNGTSWTQARPVTSPPGLFEATMVTDPLSGHPILFGGDSNGTLLNETWMWTGDDWRNISAPDSPSPRYEYAMAADTTNGQVVLFGGLGPNSTNSVPLDDTWVWRNGTWTIQRPTDSPPAMNTLAMTYAPDTGQVLMFGGNSRNWTWVWK